MSEFVWLAEGEMSQEQWEEASRRMFLVSPPRPEIVSPEEYRRRTGKEPFLSPKFHTFPTQGDFIGIEKGEHNPMTMQPENENFAAARAPGKTALVQPIDMTELAARRRVAQLNRKQRRAVASLRRSGVGLVQALRQLNF